jgi:hypothetical protein
MRRDRSTGVKWYLVLLVSLLISACGGGGGGGDTPKTDVSEGATVTVNAEQYFPLATGNSWLFDKQENGVSSLAAVSLTVTSGPSATGDYVASSLDGDTTDDTTYRIQGDGLYEVDPWGALGVFPGLYEAFRSVRVLPTGQVQVGVAQALSKAGSLQGDWDGDGKNDNYQADISLTYQGTETITVMGEAREALRFTQILKLTLISSAIKDPATKALQQVTATYNDESYFVVGLGPVKVSRSGRTSDGSVVLVPYTLLLRTAVVGGVPFGPAQGQVDTNLVQVNASRLVSDQAAPTASVMVTNQDTTGKQVYVTESHTTRGIASVQLVRLSASQTRVDIAFRSAPGQPLGPLQDQLTIRLCYDAACRFPVPPGPIAVDTVYTITNEPAQEAGMPLLSPVSQTVLTHDVLYASYSASLKAVVMASSWPENALYIRSTDTGSETKVALSKLPTALTLSPDGRQAAVGHDAKVSWVNLNTLERKLLDTSAQVFDLALDANGFVYIMPKVDQWVAVHVIDVAHNTETEQGWLLYAGSHGKLHPSGTALYTADNGLSPSDIARWNLDGQGLITRVQDSPYHGEYGMCGNLWFSEDGATIYTACGNTFRSSADKASDMRYTGKLALTPTSYYWSKIDALSQSGAANEVVALDHSLDACEISVGTTGCYHHLSFYNSDTQALLKRWGYPLVTVAGLRYTQHGVAVFHGPAGQGLFLITRLVDMPNPASEYVFSVLR